MRLIIYGERNENLDIILPYLKLDKLDKIPNEIIEIGIEEKILTRDKDTVIPGDKFVLFTEEMSELKNESFKYYTIVHESLPRLIKLFGKSNLAKQGYTWDELQHIIIFALCLDLGILKHLYKKNVISKRTTGYYLWGFTSKIVGNNPFGIKLWSNKNNQIGLGELWHPLIKSEKFGLKNEDFALINRIHQGQRIGSSDAKKVLFLKYYGLIEEVENSNYKIAIPIIDWCERDEFMVYLDQIILRITEEVTLPTLQKYNDKPIYKHGVVRLLMEYAADQLIESGLISSFAGVKKVYQKNWLFTNLFDEDSFIHYLI